MTIGGTEPLSLLQKLPEVAFRNDVSHNVGATAVSPKAQLQQGTPVTGKAS